MLAATHQREELMCFFLARAMRSRMYRFLFQRFETRDTCKAVCPPTVCSTAGSCPSRCPCSQNQAATETGSKAAFCVCNSVTVTALNKRQCVTKTSPTKPVSSCCSKGTGGGHRGTVGDNSVTEGTAGGCSEGSMVMCGLHEEGSSLIASD